MNSIILNAEITPPYKKLSTFDKQADISSVLTDYPKTALISGLALTALGAFAAISSPGTGVILGALGLTLTAATALRWKHVLSYLVAVPLLGAFGKSASTMHKHVFQERTCHVNGVERGKVTYDSDLGKDVPVLELCTSDPFEMGFVHGYLLADKCEELLQDVLRPMVGFASLLVGDFSGKKLQEGMDRVIIPEKYLTELHGIYKGYEKYCQDSGKPVAVSLNELILAHKFADIYKSIGCQRIFGVRFFNAVGCTTVAARTADGSIMAGRTLDWPAFVKGGEHMIVLRYRTSEGTSIETQTLPGVIHALTAKNSRGLVSIINELGTVSLGGVPYGLVARDVIEQAHTVEEGRKILLQKLFSKTEKPASSHHLTLVDGDHASNFQFYPQNSENFLERKLSEDSEGILIVTNHAIDENGKDIPDTEADATSHARQKAVKSVYTRNHNITTDENIKDYLKAANVLDTIAAVVYKFFGKTAAQVSAQYVHAGNYAAQCYTTG